MKKSYTDKQKVWLYPGETAAWHFFGVDKKISKKIRGEYKALSRGFGSLPVEVTVGKTTWKTSIFFDSRSEVYVLPLKAEIRKKEEIRAGNVISISFTILA